MLKYKINTIFGGNILKKQIEVVGAVIFSDNKVLCAQRNENMSLPFMWEFPGGKVETKKCYVIFKLVIKLLQLLMSMILGLLIFIHINVI